MRKFKYIGPTADPSKVIYYGEGVFTEGRVYMTEAHTVHDYGGCDDSDALFQDDDGRLMWEELWMFEEVAE